VRGEELDEALDAPGGDFEGVLCRAAFDAVDERVVGVR
jgi:hypothetical protein